MTLCLSRNSFTGITLKALNQFVTAPHHWLHRAMCGCQTVISQINMHSYNNEHLSLADKLSRWLQVMHLFDKQVDTKQKYHTVSLMKNLFHMSLAINIMSTKKTHLNQLFASCRMHGRLLLRFFNMHARIYVTCLTILSEIILSTDS